MESIRDQVANYYIRKISWSDEDITRELSLLWLWYYQYIENYNCSLSWYKHNSEPDDITLPEIHWKTTKLYDLENHKGFFGFNPTFEILDEAVGYRVDNYLPLYQRYKPVDLIDIDFEFSFSSEEL